ncbi:hypothetical protein A3A54_00480 [Candidatus Curtissbacteria bacterium RIFCSPLOWO2_01_FULL_39_62]|uniref:t-SNARE coiled-coil homology domain-containing protein n=2 Tax=Candidatus Curtissiibacteriota TaxID=1752717 RepID=A0A1F5GCF8_9BACT|nr:MAG: hypothetical protein A2775_02070 [Candidatus Curtissbacteria bacterium RIFCSPHIGHO2_01_FULL_39_57]OGD89514.1 MAG: hypothetical protein A3D04_00370 [Candidatus Curtissbacteria bacterium RIFCSPHIGHO2_02_FULL_40_16b]OGD90737.1 MAG: hypothetical protein A3E11_01945 [Candidatus Curtissbacteria bacterium RIFCSPHIGHO2_12_FULL_38_37]OGD99383.1 MAG: hypothetical protein A3J17_02440 [Candidatus Curtissbacteria bacterium RIFCSPLOWO2_02_FULL_40_11]OGE01508.1 MAG: hypothetical protein A3A54_00480 [C
MTNDDLIKSIRGVVREELEPVKETLEKHTKKLDGLTDQLADVSEGVTEIKDALRSHDKRISAMEEHLDLPTPIK